MKVLAQYGHFKVVQRDRTKTGCANGLRTGWTEYQVRYGHRVVARHELLGSAMRDARKRLDDLWDDIGAQLRGKPNAEKTPL